MSCTDQKKSERTWEKAYRGILGNQPAPGLLPPAGGHNLALIQHPRHLLRQILQILGFLYLGRQISRH